MLCGYQPGGQSDEYLGPADEPARRAGNKARPSERQGQAGRSIPHIVITIETWMAAPMEAMQTLEHATGCVQLL